MRKQLVETVCDLLESDKRVVLLLGDIGVGGFSKELAINPRVYNVGILEQASVSLAAGLAIEGMLPIFHTIAPFMVERALEQLKIDFGYQNLGGTFISVGASYDYAALGCTHHCPGDAQILRTIPNMQIFVPGTSKELDFILRETYNNSQPTYIRLSEKENKETWGSVVKVGSNGQGTVIAIGNMLDRTVEACKDMDVAIYYRNEVGPFDYQIHGPVVIVEPFYEGTSLYDVNNVLRDDRHVLCIGVPRRFLTNYGTTEQHDEACGLTVAQIRSRIRDFLSHDRFY